MTVHGLDLILWLQSLHPALAIPMEILGSLIRPEFFFMLVVPVVYWTLSPRFGWWLLAVLCCDMALGEMLRTLVAAPRPFWVEPAIQGLDPVTSVFSSPSGYASSGVVLFGAIALWSRQRAAWLAAGLLIVLTSAAKLYHGATAVDHLLWGYLQGAVVLTLWWRFLPSHIEPRFAAATPGWRLFGIATVALTLWLANAMVLQWHQGVVLPVEYAQYRMDMSERLVGGGAFFSAALLLAFGTGVVWSEARGAPGVAGLWWQKILRVVVGLPIAVILFGPLRGAVGNAMPDDGSFLSESAYALVNLAFAFAAFVWVAAIAPRLFRVLRLGAG